MPETARLTSELSTIVSDAGPNPEQRLSNTIAKRRARRYLGNKYWQEDCAFEG